MWLTIGLVHNSWEDTRDTVVIGIEDVDGGYSSVVTIEDVILIMSMSVILLRMWNTICYGWVVQLKRDQM